MTTGTLDRITEVRSTIPKGADLLYIGLDSFLLLLPLLRISGGIDPVVQEDRYGYGYEAYPDKQ